MQNDPGQRWDLFDDTMSSALRAALMDQIISRPDDARPLQTRVGLA